MEEMYIVNLYTKERFFINEFGKKIDYQEPYCEITNSDGTTMYSGQVSTLNFNNSNRSNAQKLADLTISLFQNSHSRPLLCFKSEVRGVDIDHLTEYNLSDLGDLVVELNGLNNNWKYFLKLDEVPEICDVVSL
jgi:hypothetical protein